MKNPNKRTPTQIYWPQDKYKALKRFAKDQDRTVADVVRQAVYSLINESILSKLESDIGDWNQFNSKGE